MPPVQLLPASAAAFAPRASSVNVVLSSKVEPWLTQTLKRINRVKRPLNSVAQHQRCLTETLSSPNAIWTLCSLILTKLPEAQLQYDKDGWPNANANFEMVHVEAYIVHVDMVLRNEVAFKLTADSIKTLVRHHKEVYCVDAKANSATWPEKESQLKKLHDDYVQAVNKYVFRTPVRALEGLEEEGAGELLCGGADQVKTALLAMMKPLIPPPPPAPRVSDLMMMRRHTLMAPNESHMNAPWSQPAPSNTLAAVEPWRVLGSNAAPSVPSMPANQYDMVPAPSSSCASTPVLPAMSSAAVANTSYYTASATQAPTSSPSPVWAPITMAEMDFSSISHQPLVDSPPTMVSNHMEMDIMAPYLPYTTASSSDLLYPSATPLVSAPLDMSLMGAPCGLDFAASGTNNAWSSNAWGAGAGGWDQRYHEMPTM